MKAEINKIACIADKTEAAQLASAELLSFYPEIIYSPISYQDIDLLIVLGGDGFMLHMIHKLIEEDIYIYGMNRGTVGFLLNNYSYENLYERIKSAKLCKLYPLSMEAKMADGQEQEALAFNEVSLLRETIQAAHISVKIDNTIYLNPLIGDGIIVSTAAGSSSYNMSAGGPIIPIGGNVLALTPLNPFRPRRWPGALLLRNSVIEFEVLNATKRPVSVSADFFEFKDVRKIIVKEIKDKMTNLLFDPGHSLEERILREQFAGESSL